MMRNKSIMKPAGLRMNTSVHVIYWVFHNGLFLERHPTTLCIIAGCSNRHMSHMSYADYYAEESPLTSSTYLFTLLSFHSLSTSFSSSSLWIRESSYKKCWWMHDSRGYLMPEAILPSLLDFPLDQVDPVNENSIKITLQSTWSIPAESSQKRIYTDITRMNFKGICDIFLITFLSFRPLY